MAKLCITELVLWEILKATLSNLKRSSRRGNSEAELLVQPLLPVEEDLLSDSD